MRLIAQVTGGSVMTFNIPAANVRDNQWHHLAATRYLDGAQVYSNRGFTGSLATTTFRIGSSVLSVGANFHWDGLIDEMRVWDVERSAAEINAFRLCRVPCTAAGLKAYYQFDQGTPAGNNTNIVLREDCRDQINGILHDFALLGNNSNWVCSDSAFTSAICCTASFIIAQQGCGVVGFNNITIGDYTYVWDFGDGTGSTQTSPGHTYPAPGTYTVILTATPVAGGTPCLVQQTVTVVVDVVPPVMTCPPKNCGAGIFGHRRRDRQLA